MIAEVVMASSIWKLSEFYISLCVFFIYFKLGMVLIERQVFVISPTILYMSPKAFLLLSLLHIYT